MTDQASNDLVRGYAELVSARPAYERAVAFYEGKVEEIYSSPKVSRLLTKFGLDAIDSFNFAHIPVDVVANKLHINAITGDDTDLSLNTSSSSTGASKSKPKSIASPVDRAIEDLWDYNELAEEMPIAHKKLGIFGDYYLMVWPVVGDTEPDDSKGYDVVESAKLLGAGSLAIKNESGELDGDELDNAVEVQRNGARVVAVDMIFHDPMTTRAIYDSENPRKVLFVIRSWEERDGNDLTVRANLYYPDRIERWVHKGRPSITRRNLMTSKSREKWNLFTEDGSSGVLPNPFDQIPFFHYRTDRMYGKPDHVNAYGPQLAINKLVTSHLATVDYQSFPQRYALTDPTADPSGISGTDNDFFGDTDNDDDDDPHSGMAQLEADPGTVWKLDGFKDVGQFQAANPDAYLKPFDRYVKAMAQATGIPFHFFDKQGERPPSGENIRQVNETLNSIVETRQLSVGGVHKSAFTFALNLLGHDVEKLKVVWRPIDVVTDLVGWQAVNEKQLAGVPPEVTLVEAGYLETEVAVWKEEWDRQAAEAQAFQERQLEQQQAFSSTSKVVHNSAARAMQRSTRTSNGTPKPGSGDAGTHGKKGQGA